LGYERTLSRFLKRGMQIEDPLRDLPHILVLMNRLEVEEL
jgi:hypothetical protein